MDDDHKVGRTIEDLEQGLSEDDPELAKRLRAMFRTDYATYLTVFALIATGAMLFTVGLATLSWAAWSAGLLTMLAATLLDAHHTPCAPTNALRHSATVSSSYLLGAGVAQPPVGEPSLRQQGIRSA